MPRAMKKCDNGSLALSVKDDGIGIPAESLSGIFAMFSASPYAVFLLAIWCTSTMTDTHLLSAFLTLDYMLVSIQLTERDPLGVHPEHANYRNNLPTLIPGTGSVSCNARRGPSANKSSPL